MINKYLLQIAGRILLRLGNYNVLDLENKTLIKFVLKCITGCNTFSNNKEPVKASGCCGQLARRNYNSEM